MVKSNLWCEHFFGTFKMENRWQCVCGQCWCRLSAVATVQFLFALHDSNFRNAGAGCLYMNIKMTNNKNFYEVWMGKCDVDFRIAYLSQKWPLAGKVFVSVGVCVPESIAFKNESLRNVCIPHHQEHSTWFGVHIKFYLTNAPIRIPKIVRRLREKMLQQIWKWIWKWWHGVMSLPPRFAIFRANRLEMLSSHITSGRKAIKMFHRPFILLLAACVCLRLTKVNSGSSKFTKTLSAWFLRKMCTCLNDV